MLCQRREFDASSSLLEPKDHLIDHPDTSFKDKIQVQTITLDDWAFQNNISKVDLLWLDMQGFELNMLKASNKILATVKVIHTEVSTKKPTKELVCIVIIKNFLYHLDLLR
ncbi:MAG: FkbM family methyltransferase [Saprospiraceae bacterium]|nr:FkbM family methyltransferase [Saprospiraceae bacterium]